MNCPNYSEIIHLALYEGGDVLDKHVILSFADSMYQAMGMVLSIYDCAGDSIKSIVPVEINVDLLFGYSNMKNTLLKTPLIVNKAVAVSNEINSFWFSMAVSNTKAIVLGPVLISMQSKEQVSRYYNQKGLPLQISLQLAAEYAKVVVMPSVQMFNLYTLIYHMICKEKLDLSTLFTDMSNENESQILWDEDQLYQMQQRNFVQARDSERLLQDSIRRGDVERVKRRRTMIMPVLSSLGPNELSSFKNTFIVGIALATRAAIQGGLPVEVAFPLSDKYIYQIEEMPDIASASVVSTNAMLDFATRVQKIRYKLTYSKLINQCCGYITANVNSTIKIKDLAEYLGIHPDTLAKKFKAETGVQIKDYIYQAKVEEAKWLLNHTQDSIADIAVALGFSSQSQFTVIFKEYCGVTPSKYKSG